MSKLDRKFFQREFEAIFVSCLSLIVSSLRVLTNLPVRCQLGPIHKTFYGRN
jgi:hypothetical protein